jgi:septum formation protein
VQPELPIILGSSSPRRRDLLTGLGMSYDVSVADIDENAIPYRRPRELAVKAAYAKACEVDSRYMQGVVIAADTIVVLEDEVLNKPDDEAHAREMLGRLNGRTHKVISGVAVKEVGKIALLDACESFVHIRQMDPDEIARYVATGEPLDKAGSYAIQGIGRQYVEWVEGDYFNVVGLPLHQLLDMLDQFIDTREYRCNLKNLKQM